MGQQQSFKNVKHKQLKAILMSDAWDLSNSEMQIRSYDCKTFFTSVKKQTFKIKRLNLSASNEPDILVDIMHIHFVPTLIFLDLSGNAIRSVEQLSFLDMKNLEVLVLEWNHISSLGGLRKNSFRNLEQLKLSHNFISDFADFQRAKHKKMKVIELQTPSEMFFIRETISDAVSKLAKIQSPRFYLLGLGGSMRIPKQKSLPFQAVSRKFDHYIYLSKKI